MTLDNSDHRLLWAKVIKMATIKKSLKPPKKVLARWGEIGTLLLGIKNGTAAMVNSMAVSKKIKDRITI